MPAIGPRSLIALAMLAVACSRPSVEPPSAPVVSYGTAMADVGRRFELVGKAATAGRFELARYEAAELAETFEDTLPHASPPKEGHPEVLPPQAAAFLKTNVPDLRAALERNDAAAATAAFARTAAACNACHQASGHGFIEVPTVPGQGVPSTTPAR